MSASFKDGREKSFPAYVSDAKEMHIWNGDQWHECMAVAVRTPPCRSSGDADARQCAPFELDKAFKVAVDILDIPGVPLSWLHFFFVGGSFIMRKIEVAFAVTSHVTIDNEAWRVSLQRPVPKRVCPHSQLQLSQRRACPYHAVLAQLAVCVFISATPWSKDLLLFLFKHGARDE